MVKISVNGFEFDDPEHHSTTLSKSSSTLTQNSKRFDISIDYSGGGNTLGGNEMFFCLIVLSAERLLLAKILHLSSFQLFLSKHNY